MLNLAFASIVSYSLLTVYFSVPGYPMKTAFSLMLITKHSKIDHELLNKLNISSGILVKESKTMTNF